MRILILGGDGYLGWPTAMDLRNANHEVTVVDNYSRRQIAKETDSDALIPNPRLPERAAIYKAATGYDLSVVEGDCCDYDFLSALVKRLEPDAIVHYAEQPSAPYSMIGYREAHKTLTNNLEATFNVIWSVLQNSPNCHIIKLGTMGEYGTPKIDIEEGWIEIDHKGRQR